MARSLASLASRAASLADTIARDLRGGELVELPQPVDESDAICWADVDLTSLLDFVA